MKRLESWKIRVFHQDYCDFLTFKEGEPTKCTYCLKDHPYHCIWKVSAQELLFKRLFQDEHEG